jgi:FtsP/CotA-like multicopper oxidase with cupredoxin domain
MMEKNIAMVSRRSALTGSALFILLAYAAGGGADDARAAEVTFLLPIENGRLPANMRRIRVKQGDVVTLKWSADRPTTVHLHGYDIEQQVAPGTVADMAFTARATGRFTVEPHFAKTPSASKAHGDTLVTIEVYP